MSDFLTKYVQTASSCTDAPVIYHEFGALMTVAACLGLRVWAPWGNTDIYPNLYCVLLGESTAFRKTTCLRFARNLVWRMDRDRILPDDFSYEGLFDSLAKTPAAALFFEEFENLMGKIGRENMSQLKGFLTSIYDCPKEVKKSLRGIKKQGASQEERNRTVDTLIQNPCLSIFAGSTVEWLVQRLTEEDFRSGFMARFLLVPARWRDLEDEICIPKRPAPEGMAELDSMLQKMCQVSGEMRLANEEYFLERFRAFSNKYTPRQEGAQKDKVFEPYFERLKVVALKLAMIHQITLCQDTAEIGDDSVNYGWMTVNWLANEILELKPRLAFTPHHQASLRIDELLRTGPKTRSQLLRAMPRGFRAFELQSVLENLEETDDIYCESIPGPTKVMRIYHKTNGNAISRQLHAGDNSSGKFPT